MTTNVGAEAYFGHSLKCAYILRKSCDPLHTNERRWWISNNACRLRCFCCCSHWCWCWLFAHSLHLQVENPMLHISSLTFLSLHTHAYAHTHTNSTSRSLCSHLFHVHVVLSAFPLQRHTFSTQSLEWRTKIQQENNRTFEVEEILRLTVGILNNTNPMSWKLRAWCGLILRDLEEKVT
jgi:hypothetical protein